MHSEEYPPFDRPQANLYRPPCIYYYRVVAASPEFMKANIDGEILYWTNNNVHDSVSFDSTSLAVHCTLGTCSYNKIDIGHWYDIMKIDKVWRKGTSMIQHGLLHHENRS